MNQEFEPHFQHTHRDNLPLPNDPSMSYLVGGGIDWKPSGNNDGCVIWILRGIGAALIGFALLAFSHSMIFPALLLLALSVLFFFEGQRLQRKGWTR